MNKRINAKSLTITADVITRNEVASLNSAVCVQKGQIRMSRFIIRMFLQHGLPHVEHVTFPSPVVSFTIISVSAVYSPLSAPFSQTAIPELLGTCKPGRKYRNIDRIYLHIAIAGCIIKPISYINDSTMQLPVHKRIDIYSYRAQTCV